jgi:hypothetical protein
MSENMDTNMVDETPAQEIEYHGPTTKVKLELVARDGNGNITATYCNDNDLITQQWAQFVYTQIFGVAGTIKSTTGTGYNNTAWGTLSALTLASGTGATAASVTDYVIQTPVSPAGSGTCAGTLSAFPSESSGTSGSFTVTGTITNSSGSTITYSELGIEMTDAASHVYLLTHDVFTGVPVSNTGTLAITYTITNS